MGASDGLLLALHVTFTFVAIVAVDDVIHQQTRYGTLRGLRRMYNYDLYGSVSNVIDEYLGVPYAAPPIGEKRWQPPDPPEPWQGVRNATRYGSVCPQLGIFHHETRTELQSENCLFLDIYSPYQADVPDARYPVMVYIHGGSYEVGSGRLYSGRVLAQYGVVVVTMNYRLGALGFLTTGSSSLVGNYGIMDQIEALKWVHDNIADFRGDPNQVTIFGHSAGGSSVGLLLTIPAARGLFSGAIAQSGSAVASFSCHYQKDFQWYIAAVGHLFGCPTAPIDDILKCMRSQPFSRIVELRAHFPLFDPIDPEFRPVVDGVLIPATPRELLERGEYHRVHFMTGTVKEEFDNYFNGGARHKPQFDEALDRFILRFTRFNHALGDLIRFQYTDWRHENSLDGGDEYYDRGALLSDMHMVAPTVEIAQIVASHQPEVYQYHHVGQESYHSVELNYVFGAPFSGLCADEIGSSVCQNATEKDRRHSQRVMQLWTNFAKYRQPTPADHTVDMEGDWLPFGEGNNSYLHLNAHGTHMKTHLRYKQVAFWNTLMPRLMGRLNWDPPVTGEYETQMWVFVGLTLSLLLIVIVLLILLFKARTQQH